MKSLSPFGIAYTCYSISKAWFKKLYQAGMFFSMFLDEYYDSFLVCFPLVIVGIASISELFWH